MSDPLVLQEFVHQEDTVAGAFDVAVTGVVAGNMLLVTLITNNNAATSFTITDDQVSPTNDYQRAGYGYKDPVGIAYFICRVANGGDISIHFAVSAYAGSAFVIVREVSGADTVMIDGLPAFNNGTDGTATVVMNETSVPNDLLIADYVSFVGVTLNAPETGWVVDQDMSNTGLIVESITSLPEAWGTYTAGWPSLNNPLARRWFVGAIAIIGVPITPTIQGLSTLEPREGASFTVTGVFFEASQGTGQVRINGVSMAITSWSSTAITGLPRRGLSLYGVRLGVRVHTNSLGDSNIKSVTQLKPRTGISYVNLLTPLSDASKRLTSVPDLVEAVQVAWADNGGLATVQEDGSIVVDPSVSSFEAQAGTTADGWGRIGVQSFDAEVPVTLVLPTFPASIPYPTTVEFAAVERRALSGVTGAPEVARGRSNDYLAQMTVTWMLTQAQMVDFFAFGEDDLYEWISWFSIALPGRTTYLGIRACRFIDPPKWTYLAPKPGKGLFQVTAQIEQRGRSVI